NPNGTAMINGADVTFGGLLTTYGIAEINANSRYNSTAIVDIRTDNELRLDGAAVFAGASFVQTQGTTGGIISNNGGLTVVSNTTVDMPTGVFDWDGNPGNAITTIE